MAYSVDWTARIITVPLDDLTLVSGAVWSLNTSAFWIEVRRLEASPTDGLGRPQALEFVNTQILSDIPYSPIIKLINGYTWKAGTTDKVITLLGPNSNLLDTFIPGDGVSVLANNSGGKTTDAVDIVKAILDAGLRQLWKQSGNDPSNPVTVTPTSRTTPDGDIDQVISGDGDSVSTVTAQ